MEAEAGNDEPTEENVVYSLNGECLNYLISVNLEILQKIVWIVDSFRILNFPAQCQLATGKAN